MVYFTEHDTATCPDCGEPLLWGTKEKSSGWKVLYECSNRDSCFWQSGTVTFISRSEIDHLDEVDELAIDAGSRWA